LAKFFNKFPFHLAEPGDKGAR